MTAPATLSGPDNPLLEQTGLPRFAELQPDHVAPAVASVLGDARRRLDQLVSRPVVDWDGVFGELEALDDRLSRAWSPVTHLNAVTDSPEWRSAFDAALPEMSAWETDLGQDARLWRVMRELAERADALGLDATRRKVLADWLHDFHLSGVDLPPTDKARYKTVAERLAVLESRFEQNLLDATEAWTFTLADEQRLRGLPADARERARARAERDGVPGWRVTLDAPAYLAVLTHAEDRALRETVWSAYATRASDQGPHAGRFDNGPLMREILAARHELAQLTGYPDFAHHVLTTRMAGEPARVQSFLADLVARVRPAAVRELDELRQFAATSLGIPVLAPWDVPFVTERLRRVRFDLSQEELRAWFPVARVWDGLLWVLGEVYGLRLTLIADVQVWHPDVRVYAVTDTAGALRGRLFVDLHARPGKRSGAWMDECIGRRLTDDGVQLPAAHLVCNFPAPTADTPALLTHDDVLTLFHEMGHCLHHLLTTVEVADAAGISGVEWDAVELPSQLHELFAWDPRVLARLSGHHRDGRPLPERLRDRLIAARDFHAASQMLRQLEFALYDLDLHSGQQPPDPQATLERVRREVGLLPRPDWDRFGHGFAHVFGGGYAAGYYGYLWAEVLASDAFAAFEEAGTLDRATGLRFLASVLAVGGSRDALTSFTEFRGRAPELGAFLRHHGIES